MSTEEERISLNNALQSGKIFAKCNNYEVFEEIIDTIAKFRLKNVPSQDEIAYIINTHYEFYHHDKQEELHYPLHEAIAKLYDGVTDDAKFDEFKEIKNAIFKKESLYQKDIDYLLYLKNNALNTVN